MFLHGSRHFFTIWFETGSHVAGLTLNSYCFCLHLPSTGTMDLQHSDQIALPFLEEFENSHRYVSESMILINLVNLQGLCLLRRFYRSWLRVLCHPWFVISLLSYSVVCTFNPVVFLSRRHSESWGESWGSAGTPMGRPAWQPYAWRRPFLSCVSRKTAKLDSVSRQKDTGRSFRLCLRLCVNVLASILPCCVSVLPQWWLMTVFKCPKGGIKRQL